MQPQTPLAPPPAPFDPNAAQAKQHKLMRLIVILVVIGVIGAITISLFSGPPKNNELAGVLANQQEMLRLIDERREQITSAPAANFISIVKPVIFSHSRELSDAGITVTVPVNGSGIDTRLDEAVRNSRLDQALMELIQATLEDDRQVLQHLDAVTNSDSKLKPLIGQLIEDYSALLAEAAE
jgi:hypothetical protein